MNGGGLTVVDVLPCIEGDTPPTDYEVKSVTVITLDLE